MIKIPLTYNGKVLGYSIDDKITITDVDSYNEIIKGFPEGATIGISSRRIGYIDKNNKIVEIKPIEDSIFIPHQKDFNLITKNNNQVHEMEKLTYEERVQWFVNNYYETGMEYEGMLRSFKNQDLDKVKWYDEIIKIPKYKNEILNTISKVKLEFDKWLEKYFEFKKVDDHIYYTWTYTDDDLHPNDKIKWRDDTLIDEYDKYFDNNENSRVGLKEYDE